MPRTHRHPPKYRKHRASGQAIVTLNGRDHYLGPHGTKASHREYDRLVCEWLANNRQPLGGVDCLTTTELIATYLLDAAKIYTKNGKPTKEISNLKAALRPVREMYGREPAQEFGPLALEAVRQKMIGYGWARGNVNDMVDRVRRAFRWGVRKQLIPPAVIQALETVPGLRRGQSEARETDPIQPVDDSTINATLPHLPEVVADMVQLQRATAMRPSEVCILRPCDLDRSGDVWLYRPESHKTQHLGRERVVPIGPRGQAILLRYLARDAQAHCFRPCDSEAKRLSQRHEARTVPVSCGNVPGTNRVAKPKRQPGEVYDVDAYRRAIHRACDKAGVERWSPNRLRHTTATAIRKEFGLEAAQVILGHSTAAITQVYAERDLAKGLHVAQMIG